ncbi:MAG: response regulator [Bacteroidales bacterium]|nr:response regulator [Bacteroidales bacterium]
MSKLNISVLYVEDENILRIIYVRVLEKAVARLFVAENGKEGLEIYERERPDLIITDIMMPVMNGLDMIKRIRNMDEQARFVIMTAYSETDYFMDAIRIGVNSFLIKPVEVQKLTDLVHEISNSILLGKKVAEQELRRKKAESNLRKLNEELENRIKERTADLEKEINERIQAEKKLMELNLTLEKRVREELQKRQKQQQLLVQKSRLESIGELAAGIAHEINQPLGSISLGLDNILLKLNADKLPASYLQEKINTIFNDIERIRQIINHVRIFSRDQGVTEKERVDMNEVVRNALSMVAIQYRQRGIFVTTELAGACCTMGNKYRLEQVLLNLISNARYAVAEKAKKLQSKDYRMQIFIRTRVSDSKVLLEVEDNGTGISRKNMPHIFEPFFTTKDVEKGTGLGLSIIYGIIRDIDGNIHVESKVNQFTRVLVTLPLCD